MFILISSVSFAASPDTVKTSSKEVVDLVKEGGSTVYNDVKGVIKQLASALQVGAEHVYIILVKQQIINSVVNVIIYIMLMILIYYGGKWLFASIEEVKEMNKDLGRYDSRKNIADNTSRGFVSCVMLVIGSLSFAIFFFFTISDTVTGFLNPEYLAIHYILNMIR